jgi:hypothetical protein
MTRSRRNITARFKQLGKRGTEIAQERTTPRSGKRAIG